MTNFLYAKEWDVDIPKEVYGVENNLTVANKASEAIDLISQREFDAYVLGMVMVRDGVNVDELRRLERMKSDLAQEMARFKEVNTSVPDDINFRYSHFREDICECLDYKAGERVFGSLVKRGVVGRKPLLFFTSQHGLNSLVRSDKKRLISVASMPTWSENLEKWFSDPYTFLNII